MDVRVARRVVKLGDAFHLMFYIASHGITIPIRWRESGGLAVWVTSSTSNSQVLRFLRECLQPLIGRTIASESRQCLFDR